MKRTAFARLFLPALLIAAAFAPAAPARAQEVVPDTVTYEKGRVAEVVSSEEKLVPGTDTKSNFQTIKVKMLDGPSEGSVLTIDNDFLLAKPGDVLYLMHRVNRLDGVDAYSVSAPYRLPVIAFFVGLFLACLFFFGGIQGVRGLVALCMSFFFIGYLLLPGILAGYPPVLVALGVSALIIVLGSYVTHGFNRTTTTAVLGMLATIAITGALAYAAIHLSHLTGFTNEEAVYLNFDTRGSIDLVGLLLGSILIGILGVLYDAAIGQSIAVEELISAGGHLSAREIYRRALRIGREHIGALVNMLAIAYVGAALPLLLLFQASYTQSLEVTLNQELFATEILRTMLGSIGIILTVPITTAVAVWMLHGRELPPSERPHGHVHK
ncbi:MAG TPA: YibE/F family protein [Candidatus Paceibacterota bacterium]|nr:YibE/F family protein [Candidatus Paceibacterota bacterium]